MEQHILIVEPEILVAQALSALIESWPGYRVRWLSRNAEDALHQLTLHSPTVVITAVDLPGRTGIELVHEIQRQGKNVRTLILSRHAGEDKARLALRAGASGYFMRNGESSELRHALETVAEGKRYVPSELEHLLSEPIAAGGMNGNHYGHTNLDPLGLLSTREREIFHMLASGLQNAVIAKQLHISPLTVETHRARVVRKLGVSSNADLIRFAIKQGLSTL